jgi:RHS repeat-associated protein
MPGRIFQGQYRYGFNRMEKDDEVKGEGNSLDFGARIYDCRLGRWLSTDPLQSKYPDLSSYHFSGNSPIRLSDYNGMDFGIDGDLTNKSITVTTTYYVAAENITRTNDAAQLWNKVSGEYYYRTGDKKHGYEYYAINFALTAKEGGYADRATNKGTNVLEVVNDNDSHFGDLNPQRGALTINKSRILVRNSRKNETLPTAHELGHALIGGVGHTTGTLMNDAIEGSPDGNPYSINNTINEDVIRDILGSAGFGRKIDKALNKSKLITIIKGLNMGKISNNGKVISKKTMLEEMNKQKHKGK